MNAAAQLEFLLYVQAMLSSLDVLVVQAVARSNSYLDQQQGESVVLIVNKECTTMMELAVNSVLVGI